MQVPSPRLVAVFAGSVPGTSPAPPDGAMPDPVRRAKALDKDDFFDLLLHSRGNVLSLCELLDMGEPVDDHLQCQNLHSRPPETVSG